MLNYAPDGMAGGISTLYIQDWAPARPGAHLMHDALILRLFPAPGGSSAHLPPTAFQPERVSGFCAC